MVIYSFPRSGNGFLSKNLSNFQIANHVEPILSGSSLTERNVNVVVLRNSFDCILSNIVTEMHKNGSRHVEYEYEKLEVMAEYWINKYKKYLENIEAQSNKIFGFTFEDLFFKPELVFKLILKESFPEGFDIEGLPIFLKEMETGYKKTFDSSGQLSDNTAYFLKTASESEHYAPVKQLLEAHWEQFEQLVVETKRVQLLIKRSQLQKGISIPR